MNNTISLQRYKKKRNTAKYFYQKKLINTNYWHIFALLFYCYAEKKRKEDATKEKDVSLSEKNPTLRGNLCSKARNIYSKAWNIYSKAWNRDSP